MAWQEMQVRLKKIKRVQFESAFAQKIITELVGYVEELIRVARQRYHEVRSLSNEARLLREGSAHLINYIYYLQTKNAMFAEYTSTHYRPGYVYLMVNDKNEYKIGVSKSPEVRMNTLSVKHGKMKCIALIYTDDCITIERLLHGKFRRKCIRREWFNLDKSDIAEFCLLADFVYPEGATMKQVRRWTRDQVKFYEAIHRNTIMREPVGFFVSSYDDAIVPRDKLLIMDSAVKKQIDLLNKVS